MYSSSNKCVTNKVCKLITSRFTVITFFYKKNVKLKKQSTFDFRLHLINQDVIFNSLITTKRLTFTSFILESRHYS